MVYHQLAKQNRRKSSRGTAIMEFAIVMTIMIPLFCGMALVGLSSTTGIQAAQTTRDIGHMYSLGIDFSAATTNDEEAANVAMPLPLTATGSGVTVLTQVKEVTPADCTAQGLSNCANTTSATLADRQVIIQRVVLGNTSLLASRVGTPPTTYTPNGATQSTATMNAQGNVAPNAYLTKTALRATNANKLPAVPAGIPVYVAESYFQLPALSFLSNFGTTINGVYTVCYF